MAPLSLVPAGNGFVAGGTERPSMLVVVQLTVRLPFVLEVRPSSESVLTFLKNVLLLHSCTRYYQHQIAIYFSVFRCKFE